MLMMAGRKTGDNMKLSTKELAELKGCTQRNIKLLAQSGKLCGEITKNEKNRPAYQFALDALEPELQIKYYRQHGFELPKELCKPKKPQPVKEPKPLDAYTAAQREEISRWIDILKDWQSYRALRKDKESADTEYIAQCRDKYPDIHISRDILSYVSLSRGSISQRVGSLMCSSDTRLQMGAPKSPLLLI